MNDRVDGSNHREERETSKAMQRILNDQGCEQRQVQSDRCNHRQRIERDPERARKLRLSAT